MVVLVEHVAVGHQVGAVFYALRSAIHRHQSRRKARVLHPAAAVVPWPGQGHLLTGQLPQVHPGQGGQALTGVLVEMANLSTLIRAGDAEATAAKAGEIKKEVEASIGVVRNLSLLLRPSMLDDLGLAPALQWQAREVSKRSGVWVKVDAEGISDDLPEEHKTCVYRLVQEALHNCVQHAGAHNVRVTVERQHGRLLLSIQDDGKGFNAQQERGMGLLGMEERVSHLGGVFSVHSEPGQGAELRVELPLPAELHEARETA